MSSAVKVSSGRERSFTKEAEKLLLGEGDEFHGEAILAVTKAILQSGVSYVGGYPGAPISHLIDVLADARDTVLDPMGIYFEQSASEAGAAALLGTSINYPLRGAVTWKSIVGTNVASDALSNLSSAGVKGGAVIIMGDDYGEGASIIQERTHATAMKSSMPLIDPRYDMGHIVDMTQHAFELSEACHQPVILSLRIRACHMTGSFIAKDNIPAKSLRNAPVTPDFDYGRIVLPPSIYAQEVHKNEVRLPAAINYIREHNLNETMPGKGGNVGIILQGGIYGVVMRALSRLGLADGFGKADIPLHVMNVVHPLVPDQIEEFARDKDSLMIIEEGHPAFIEDQVRSIIQSAGLSCNVHGKDVMPTHGEYVTGVVRDGIAAYLEKSATGDLKTKTKDRNDEINANVSLARAAAGEEPLPTRPPGFCTGCPERPIFSAIKLLKRERGDFHVSADIGCSTFASLPPFNIGNTVLGYGMSLASGGAIANSLDQPTVAVMGDGGFWHNGLSTGVINARWQGMDAVLVILENGYASATGQHHLPSTGSTPTGIPANLSIEEALRGVGVSWIKRVDSYAVADTLTTLREAFDARDKGLRVILSDNECMLAKKRRGNRIKKLQEHSFKQAKYGVDPEVCTGDHSCIRLSGCPSLTVKSAVDPLKDGPVAHVDNSCAACNLCGEVAQAAQLCPSFYKVTGVTKATFWSKLGAKVNRAALSLMGAS